MHKQQVSSDCLFSLVTLHLSHMQKHQQKTMTWPRNISLAFENLSSTLCLFLQFVYIIFNSDLMQDHMLFYSHTYSFPTGSTSCKSAQPCGKSWCNLQSGTATPWCAGMVVFPKKNGKVRICVDLKPLNYSVLREVHPLPKVDETLAQQKIFSKLDANSGFWQIPVTIITPPHYFYHSYGKILLQQLSYHSEYQVP